MAAVRYVDWQDDDFWLGYIEQFPDCLTQGLSLEELHDNLADLYKDLAGGEIPCIRKPLNSHKSCPAASPSY